MSLRLFSVASVAHTSRKCTKAVTELSYISGLDHFWTELVPKHSAGVAAVLWRSGNGTFQVYEVPVYPACRLIKASAVPNFLPFCRALWF